VEAEGAKRFPHYFNHSEGEGKKYCAASMDVAMRLYEREDDAGESKTRNEVARGGRLLLIVSCWSPVVEMPSCVFPSVCFSPILNYEQGYHECSSVNLLSRKKARALTMTLD